MAGVKAGVVVFPGSNCDHDIYYILKHIMNTDTEFLWHKEQGIGDRNLIILPGGFSFGDYLRCGAAAKFSPVMNEVIRFANNGGVVIGICNGFQVLCETGLLPGVLLRNENLKFVCKTVTLKVENNKSIFTGDYEIKEEINIPVAHGEGNYYCDSNTHMELVGNNQILFRYTDNPNGSLDDIAGIQNINRNVFGMMPHPERASDKILGNTDGYRFFKSVVESIQ
ncbi:MAG: phosphoribosylformylglycinamidine synthase subunit PurQ [Ignavibacteriae bacterium]|nr:phosphoribosylformylglycinamidine synthase subunit PurQ [Ignavibacteriota bacterium]